MGLPAINDKNYLNFSDLYLEIKYLKKPFGKYNDFDHQLYLNFNLLLNKYEIPNNFLIKEKEYKLRHDDICRIRYLEFSDNVDAPFYIKDEDKTLAERYASFKLEERKFKYNLKDQSDFKFPKDQILKSSLNYKKEININEIEYKDLLLMQIKNMQN